ncbi:hypothetical protein K505DRAFT_72193 [Melanomma pulvis-pyrius CBS 109.77]|uniref:Uncharacterized protein n=1 Tax=Melanomma pulvis-pyrius CBS 109.77 TaxID=1314802 RepID=A0A6A6X568_9PLEO|nr:hypothetical protein K505DRAFT_72193 [Melanomma pulvis-pyrius CBS 109.77]
MAGGGRAPCLVCRRVWIRARECGTLCGRGPRGGDLGGWRRGVWDGQVRVHPKACRVRRLGAFKGARRHWCLAGGGVVAARRTVTGGKAVEGRRP